MCRGIGHPRIRCAKLRARGYNVVAGDACTSDLGRQFECVVAGDIIEHVDNPGMMIRNLARHLKPNGKLFLTTPNAHFGLHMVESVVCDPKRRWHPQHVAWYDPFTLQNMVKRCGLRAEACLDFTRSRKLRKLLQLGVPCWSILASSVLIVAVRDE